MVIGFQPVIQGVIMSIIGTWKVNSIGKFVDEKFVYVPVEEYLNAPYTSTDEHEVAHEKKERMNFAMMKLCFMEGGMLRTLFPLPEGVAQEEIDAAVADGQIKIDGDYMYEESSWKEENGVAMIKAGKMTQDGVTVDNYEPLKIDEEGFLIFFTTRMEKEE